MMVSTGTRPSGSRKCASGTPASSPASGPGELHQAMGDGASHFPSLGSLGARFGLTAAQTQQLQSLGAILAEDEHAPTTVHDPVRVRDDHLADSLVALDLPVVRSAEAIADLGAGA